jgi:hypothetical protein
MHIYIGSLFKHTRGNDEKLSMRKGFIYLPKKVNSLSSPGGSSVAIVMLYAGSHRPTAEYMLESNGCSAEEVSSGSAPASKAERLEERFRGGR